MPTHAIHANNDDKRHHENHPQPQFVWHQMIVMFFHRSMKCSTREIAPIKKINYMKLTMTFKLDRDSIIQDWLRLNG
jgi:hypothetical protein